MADGGNVTRAWVRPDAVTNSTSMASGAYTSTTVSEITELQAMRRLESSVNTTTSRSRSAIRSNQNSPNRVFMTASHLDYGLSLLRQVLRPKRRLQFHPLIGGETQRPKHASLESSERMPG